METIIPTADGYSGLFLTGFRIAGGAIQQVGTIIVKREYDVEPNDGQMTPRGADLEGLVLADVTVETSEDGDLNVHVVRESDLVPYKPLVDVIVLGRQTDDVGGAVFVEDEQDGQLRQWLRRQVLAVPDETPLDRDSELNLFGFEPKSASSVRQPGDYSHVVTPEVEPEDYKELNRAFFPHLWPTPADQPLRAPLPAGFGNLFYNAHRRSGDFSATANVAAALPADAKVEVFLNPDGTGDPDTTLSLALPRLEARYFYQAGGAPDREARWCPVDLGALRPDTLVVAPDDGQASVVWRGLWDYDEQAPDSYRRVAVTEGSS